MNLENYANRKIGIIALTLLLVLAMIGLYSSNDVQNNQVTVLTENGPVNVTVEIAENDSERARGLMYRKKLDINKGMLFVFPDEEPRSFWMKNTYIPLEIVFIDSNGRILNIEEAIPQPNASDSELKRYRSEGEAKYVLELNSTFSEKYGLNNQNRINLYK